MGNGLTDWKRLRKMRDEDIVYDEDSPDLSELIDKGLVRRVGRPIKEDKKESVCIRLDPDLLKELRKKKNWQTRVNNALRGMMELL